MHTLLNLKGAERSQHNTSKQSGRFNCSFCFLEALSKHEKCQRDNQATKQVPSGVISLLYCFAHHCKNSEPCIACSLLQSSKFTTCTSLFTLLEASQLLQCHYGDKSSRGTVFQMSSLSLSGFGTFSIVLITSYFSSSTHPNSSLPDPSPLSPPPEFHNTTPTLSLCCPSTIFL
jgi:hypothetical protein